MGWYHDKREISKEEYDDIKAGKRRVRDFFSDTEIMGYGAIPDQPVEKDGKYYIPYGISDTCD